MRCGARRPSARVAISSSAARQLPADFIAALALIKAAAARANARLGLLPEDVAAAIADAALAVARGAHDAQFPLDVFQTGSGTSTNMNVNEVIAHLAGAVAGHARCMPTITSTCARAAMTCIPSAIHLSARAGRTPRAAPGARRTARACFGTRSRPGRRCCKTGRTHLMDAMPMTLGQEASGWRAQIDNAIERLRASEPRLLALAQGGTAIGTGINAHAEVRGARSSKSCAR